MRTLREWILRLGGALRPGRRDEELAEELRLHAELAVEAAQRRGLDPGAAGRAARIHAGGTAQAMDALRDQRGLPWLDDLGRDLRHGIRSLRRTPVFTAVALIILALGIGANTAIFSIVNAVILQPLPYPRPEQLMYVNSQVPRLGLSVFSVSHPEYLELRQLSQSFSAMGVFRLGEVNLTAGDRPVRVRSAAIDEYLLPTLGFQPVEGRFFSRGETETENSVGGAPLAILSSELWRSAFGAQPIVGRAVEVDGRTYDVIGITPPGADLMDSRVGIWVPLGLQPDIRRARGLHNLRIIARLKDGVTLDDATAELASLVETWAARVGTKDHAPDPNHPLQARPLHTVVVGDASRAIWALQAAVGFVLLIACANLANLLLARAESRRREFAMRAALGASRGRLFRQALAEGLLLSLGGGLLGLWVAMAGVPALIRAYPDILPRTGAVTIDLRVLAFACAVSIATGILFGLAPVPQRWTRDGTGALSEGGGRSAGIARHFVRRLLVVAEVALAVMLVIGAGLLVRTVYNLSGVDDGFDRSRLATFSMSLPMATSEPDTRARTYARLLDELRQAPGVEAATAMWGLPLMRGAGFADLAIEGGDPALDLGYYQLVMSDYFETMGIPIVAGRGFEPADVSSPGLVAIVNETLARQVWPGRSPLGQRVQPDLTSLFGAGTIGWHTVIGVARDVKQGVERATEGELYVFAEQHAMAPPTMNVALRTTLPPASLSQTIERMVRTVDPSVPVVRLRDMEDVFDESIGRPRLLAQLLVIFGGLAVLLAMVGTYGVLSYLVMERRREVGVRMALGAARGRVVAMVMKQGLALIVIGIAAGLAGAMALNHLIAALLFGVEPTDPAIMAAVAAGIALVAALACWLPAWRASRLDPNIVLRAE
jgi:putative ABC transport system permease protein